MRRIALGLGLALGLGACHRLGPVAIQASRPRPMWSPAPALSAGPDKGSPRYAVGLPRPPALGSEPSTTDIAMTPPYRHDGARIERSLTTGVAGSDHPPPGTD